MSRRLSIILACIFTTIVLVSYRLNRQAELQFEEYNAIDPNISKIFATQREIIRKEMQNFVFESGIPADLDDLTLEKGGNPVRTIILTTWRSGSTFLGDVLKSIPGSYYFFEPLLQSGLHRYRKSDSSEENEYALHHIKQLLSCDFTDMDRYLEYGERRGIVFSHNKYLWEHCNLNSSQYCKSQEFMSGFCKLFPFITMKTVRLGLDLAQTLLNERNLNIRVLLLVRDPRGTIHSRELEQFCTVGPECDSPRRLCNDLKDDFEIAKELKAKFPQQFEAIRYEDLSIDLSNKTREIFKFLGLPFHTKVGKFLQTHSKYKVGNHFSTYRNTSVAPFHWMLEMDIERIRQIEQICADALDVWGYRIAGSYIEYRGEKVESVLYKNYKPFI